MSAAPTGGGRRQGGRLCGGGGSGLLMTSLSAPADKIRTRSVVGSAYHYRPWYSGRRRCWNDAKPSRRLRIGYVSGDFKQHSASDVLAPLVMGHTDAFEVYCYSEVRSPDTVVDGRSTLTATGLPFTMRATLPEWPVVA